jgi:hypothetical protein
LADEINQSYGANYENGIDLLEYLGSKEFLDK